MDPVYQAVAEIVKVVGLTPACIVALIALLMQYRLLNAKDRVIEKMADSLQSHTKSVIQIKTIIEALMLRGGAL